MSWLREQSKEIHDLAEKTILSQELINGTVSKLHYLKYLNNRFLVLSAIELKLASEMPVDLKRMCSIRKDIIVCDPIYDVRHITNSALIYHNHLLSLDKKKLYPHVYVHYLGDLYGGKIIKKALPFQAYHLDFKNPEQCIQWVRDRCEHTEEFLQGVNTAFDYVIKIYDEIVQ